MTTVIEAVNQVTQDARERLALLMGALLEGGSLGASGFGIGDNGTSFGPWQIHLPAHPGVSAAQASDPLFAAQYMQSSYKHAVQQVDPNLWNTNPAQGAAQAAYIAESPAYMYPAERIASAWRMLTGGQNVSLPNTPTDNTGVTPVIDIPGSGAITDAFKAIGDAIAKPFQAIADIFGKIVDPHLWWRVLFVIGGLGIIAVGLGLMNTRAVETAAGTFAGSAAKAP